MGAWLEPKGKVLIAKGGKKNKTAVFKNIFHKNKMLKGCKYNATWSGNASKSYKLKRPEGVYDIAIIVSYKTGQKVKGMSNNKPGGIPEECKLDSSWEFPEIRVGIKSLKMPQMHTCEVEAKFIQAKNVGSSKDMDPCALIELTLRTGHMITGYWFNHFHFCTVSAGRQKVFFGKR